MIKSKNITPILRNILFIFIFGISLWATNAPIAVPDDAPWKGKENKPISVNTRWAKGMTGIANQFALANGWYKDANITFNDLETTSVNPVPAFSSGDIEFADGDPGTYVPAIINKVPIKIVGNMWRNRGAFWIIANNNIKSWEDFKGKKIGTSVATGGMKLAILEVLGQNGIEAKEIEAIANGSYQAAYATFISGDVDATVIHQPYATLAEKDGKGKAWAKTWEYIPDYHTGVLVASDRLIEKEPETLERILEIYYYANEYARTHLDEFIPWAAKYLNLDEETARTVFQSEKVLWENDPIVNVERLQKTEDLLFKHGMQRTSFDVSKGVVDNQFAEKVAEKLKLGKYRPQN
jgi:NitT/TauT family transport system substrate-binding protein